MRRAALLAVFLLALSPPLLAAGDPGLLPPDGFGGTWHLKGPAKVYEGAQLYDHIDGGGEPFLEIGFEACTVQRYVSGKEEAVFEVYRMADETAALGVFLAAGGRIDLASPGEFQVTEAPTQATLRKGRYYVVATCYEGRPGMAGELAAFAAYAASKTAAGALPPVLALLPKEPVDPGTLRLFRGPVGLQAVATLGEGDVLSQGGKVAAAAADYGGKGHVRTVIALAYPSPAAASAALAHLRANLDSLLKPVKSEEGLLVFKDAQGRFGRAALEGPKLTVELGLPEP